MLHVLHKRKHTSSVFQKPLKTLFTQYWNSCSVEIFMAKKFSSEHDIPVFVSYWSEIHTFHSGFYIGMKPHEHSITQFRIRINYLFSLGKKTLTPRQINCTVLLFLTWCLKVWCPTSCWVWLRTIKWTNEHIKSNEHTRNCWLSQISHPLEYFFIHLEEQNDELVVVTNLIQF